MDAWPGVTGDVTGIEPALRVVVGVDGSEGSLTALRWAMHWALARDAEVSVLASYPTVAYWTDAEVLERGVLDVVHDDMWARARTAVDAVRDSESVVRDVPVSLHIEPGPAAAQLVRHSAEADLLVVGSRGRSAVRSALLGSVALHCVSAAQCPVVVVPQPGRWGNPGADCQVVVGIDGSKRSAAALSAAMTAAGPGGSVTAVRAHDVTDFWSDGYGVAAATALEGVNEDSLARMQVLVTELRAATPGAHPEVRRLSLTGPAGAVLVEQASAADLLVVASRGHGEFLGLILGSVALHCVVHAPCPVLVLRPVSRRATARPAVVAAAAG